MLKCDRQQHTDTVSAPLGHNTRVSGAASLRQQRGGTEHHDEGEPAPRSQALAHEFEQASSAHVPLRCESKPDAKSAPLLEHALHILTITAWPMYDMT